MKTKRERVGFTLIELLVVIAILGILMAMMVPAAGLILRRAKVAQAKGDAGVVTTVLMKYFAEYNRWPGLPPGGENRLTTDNVWVQAMSPEPRQDGDEPSAYNFKGLRFFEPSGGALAPDGQLHAGAFIDPWGTPFQYQMDDDRDGTVPHPSGDGIIRAQVVAWSAGPDGDYETWADNATSWE